MTSLRHLAALVVALAVLPLANCVEEPGTGDDTTTVPTTGSTTSTTDPSTTTTTTTTTQQQNVAVRDVIINEVFYGTSEDNTGGNSEFRDDFIELKNMTGEAINLGGWTIAEAAGGFSDFTIPLNTMIPANGFVVIRDFDNMAFDGMDSATVVYVTNEADFDIFFAGEEYELRTVGGMLIDATPPNGMDPAPPFAAGTDSDPSRSMERITCNLNDGADPTQWQSATSTGAGVAAGYAPLSNVGPGVFATPGEDNSNTPAIQRAMPANGTFVALNEGSIMVEFTAPMNAADVAGAITVNDGNGDDTANWSVTPNTGVSRMFTFARNTDLTDGLTYSVSHTAVDDVCGNTIAAANDVTSIVGSAGIPTGYNCAIGNFTCVDWQDTASDIYMMLQEFPAFDAMTTAVTFAAPYNVVDAYVVSIENGGDNVIVQAHADRGPAIVLRDTTNPPGLVSGIAVGKKISFTATEGDWFFTTPQVLNAGATVTVSTDPAVPLVPVNLDACTIDPAMESTYVSICGTVTGGGDTTQIGDTSQGGGYTVKLQVNGGADIIDLRLNNSFLTSTNCTTTSTEVQAIGIVGSFGGVYQVTLDDPSELGFIFCNN